MTRRTNELCVFCNVEPGNTSDHVIARAFFTKPLPNVVATVPACDACQAAKAIDETKFRDLLVLDPMTAHNPFARELRAGAVSRSAEYGSSQIVKDALMKGRPDPNPPLHLDGIPLILDVETDLVIRTLTRIAYGIYYRVMKRQRLPRDLDVQVGRVNDGHVAEVWDAKIKKGTNGPLGYPRMFDALLNVGPIPGQSSWLMCFYEGVTFSVETNPRGCFIGEYPYLSC